MLAIAATTTFVACKKDEVKTTSVNNTQVTNPTAMSKMWWDVLWDILTGKTPTVRTSYRSGYYESTGELEHQFKCNPGESVCEFTVYAGSGMSIPDGTTPINTQPNGYAEAFFVNGNGNLGMLILKNSMTQSTYEENYADGVLTVPGNWKLQSGLQEALSLPEDYTIPQGNYLIHEAIHNGVTYLEIQF